MFKINKLKIGLVSLFIIIIFSFSAYSSENNYPVVGHLSTDNSAYLTINDNLSLKIKSKENLFIVKRIARKMNQLIYENKLNPNKIQPVYDSGNYIIKSGGNHIFKIDQKIAKLEKEFPAALSIIWANKIREAFGKKKLSKKLSRSLLSIGQNSQFGYSSWYGGKFHGRLTANGEVYNMHGISAAHRTLPLGTWLLVTNLDNGRNMKVRVNDRGPFVKTHRRIIDLSYGAFKRLGVIKKGIMRVRIDVLK